MRKQGKLSFLVWNTGIQYERAREVSLFRDRRKEEYAQSKMIKFSRQVDNSVKGGIKVRVLYNWTVFLS